MKSPDELRKRYKSLPVSVARKWSLAGREVEIALNVALPNVGDDTIEALLDYAFDGIDQREYGQSQATIEGEARQNLIDLGATLTITF